MAYKRFSLQRYSRETRFELPLTMNASAELNGNCQGTVRILIALKDTAELSATARTLAKLQPQFKLSASLEGSTKAGMNIYQPLNFIGKLSSVSSMGSIIHMEHLFASSLGAFVSLDNLSTETISILSEIPPGAELRVDCENYSVTLNGENILHLHEGDWPQFSRDLMSLLVSCGNGSTLEGHVLYRERWL